MSTERKCITCGLWARDWMENEGRGYVHEGAWYCSRGCAQVTRRPARAQFADTLSESEVLSKVA